MMPSTYDTLELTRSRRTAAETIPLPRLRFEVPTELHARLVPPVPNTFDCARLVRSLRTGVVLS